MTIKPLSIIGAWIYEPEVYSDNRGSFFEWFQDSTLNSKLNSKFNLAQANCSISQKGTLRGIHFTSSHPGQSKVVTVLQGKVQDVIVDLRKNSPTFGKWESITLDSDQPRTLYIPWGVGHGFMALEDKTVFVYLCDKRYDPSNEFDLNAFDPEINIDWPTSIKFIQSEKDKRAPYLKNILDRLPN